MNLPLENCDYFIYYMKMPPKIYACVVVNDDGTFSMYLDPRRSFDQMVDDYTHELLHIVRDDFYNGQPICEVEDEVQEMQAYH